MTAAAIVPTIVEVTRQHSTSSTGTPMRLIKYIFKGTKVTDADWIVTATYFQSGTPLFWNVCTIDSSSDGLVDGTIGCTWVASGTKLTLSGGTTGTSYGEIWFEES